MVSRNKPKYLIHIFIGFNVLVVLLSTFTMILPISFREACFTILGVFFKFLYDRFFPTGWRSAQPPSAIISHPDGFIEIVQQLRKILPPGPSGTNFQNAKKIISYLDDQMIDYIHKSPFLQLSSIDSENRPFISPKGGSPGFVKILQDKNGKGTTLIIPDRPGNRLLFGLQNIIQHPNVSILFEIPGTYTTLRCGGRASISTSTKYLHHHSDDKNVKLVILVQIQHAFFHCAKAYMRSRLWNHNTWPSESMKISFGRYFSPKDLYLAKKIDADVANHYKEVQQVLDGPMEEKED